jgi:hypothetical protein
MSERLVSASSPSPTSAAAGTGTAIPASGDIVVTRGSERSGSYTVTQVPDPPCFVCATLPDAVDAARTFARIHRVDVWVGDGEEPMLRHVFRPGHRLPPPRGTRR